MTQFNIERLIEDIRWLVEDIGPRPYGSQNANLAAIGIERRLQDAGWKPQTIQMYGNLVACRGNGSVLLLAHPDTVPSSPGALDNASGVATLLELARKTTAKDLCLAFPTAEENGLLGSRQLVTYINKWHPDPQQLKVVVSLDLVGHGELSITGLNKKWSENNLRWLYGHIQPHSEYGYQAFSRLLPSHERSDHLSFVEKGYMGFHLLGRNDDGITSFYHRPEDDLTQIDAASFTPLLEGLESLVNSSDIPVGSAGSTNSIILGNTVLSGWIIWLLLIIGILSSLDLWFSQWKNTLIDFGKALIAVLGAGLILYLFTLFSIFPQTQEELTAAMSMGIKSTGWWQGSTYGWVIALATFFGIRTVLKPKGSATLLTMFFLLPMAYIDPILAAPMAVGAILARLWGPLALIGGLYWLQPAIMRELSFHGLVPPIYWPLLFLFLIPSFGLGRIKLNEKKA